MKFTLRTLCFLILVLALILGAYRWGFRVGRDYRDPIVVTTQAHRLPFQLDSEGRDCLCKYISQTFEPQSWEDPDSALLFAAPGSDELIVRNHNRVHKQIAGLIKALTQIEEPRNKSLPGAPQGAQEFLKALPLNPALP
jgi:hypothetical protein